MTENKTWDLVDAADVQNVKIAIIGGGLVGSLAARSLSKLGYEIHLYEYREDIRKSELVVGRSINLALSVRGRNALAEIGLEEEILKHGIPMRGRLLHDRKGKTKIIPYDANTNQAIYSVGRKYLNERLLTDAELEPRVHLHFNHKLTSYDLASGQLNFTNPITNETSYEHADLILGCDGAYSAVRRQMLQRYGFDYSQTYIEHGYIELCIPPNNGQFAMPHNYLHIWPRGQFMMIALPNQDHSWTVTLFMPFVNFHKLATSEELLKFFEYNFMDAIPLIGEKRLIEDFFKTKPQHLVSVKCHPYHVDSNVLILGDAAHAMVPFFGQGMNAGFEDVFIFTSLLKQNKNNFQLVLEEFSEQRWRSAHAICDLAMVNYTEMRDLVTRTSFRMRKGLDDYLFWLMPKTWVPLYNSVSFSLMPYEHCKKNRQWQNRVLTRCLVTGLLVAVTSLTAILYKIAQKFY